MRITRKDLQISVENLSNRLETITGKRISYSLVAGDARLGKVYSIRLSDHNTICSFMGAKELDAYIWGMYKAFDLLQK